MTVVGSESLRAPEVILRAGYGPEIDIWAIGCTVRVFLLRFFRNFDPCLIIHVEVFEMLTGRWLLKPDLEEEDPWTAEDDLLAKMMELTGERFSDTPLLSRGERYKEFFDDKGNTNAHIQTEWSDLTLPLLNRKPLANSYPRSSIIRKCSEELSNSHRQRGHRSRSVHF